MSALAKRRQHEAMRRLAKAKRAYDNAAAAFARASPQDGMMSLLARKLDSAVSEWNVATDVALICHDALLETEAGDDSCLPFAVGV